MKNVAFITLICAAAIGAHAETSAKEGLSRLKTNYENSRGNLEDYTKNLNIVDGNITEVAKAKSEIQSQEKEVDATASKNLEGLKTVESKEQELLNLIASEQKQITLEDQKTAELEKILLALKSNQSKRQANIANYQEQLKAISNEKKDWKTRQEQIAKSQALIKSKLTSLNQQESDWKNKKRGYEGEVTRWKKEVEREKKLMDTYNSLSEVKD